MRADRVKPHLMMFVGVFLFFELVMGAAALRSHGIAGLKVMMRIQYCSMGELLKNESRAIPKGMI